MEGVLGQASELKTLVDAIKDVVISGAKFVFSSSGLSLKAMDSSNCSIIEIFLPCDALPHYHWDNASSMALRLDLLLHLLNQAYHDDIIYFKSQERDYSFTFMFQGPDESYYRWVNLIMDIDTGSRLHAPEEAEYTAMFMLPSLYFTSICFHLGAESDTVIIHVADVDNVKIYSSVDFWFSKILCMHQPNEAMVTKVAQPAVCVAFNFTEVSMVTQAMALSDTLTIGLSRELRTAMFEYKIFAQKGYVRFHLPIKYTLDL